MLVFDKWSDAPINFLGECYVLENKCRYVSRMESENLISVRFYDDGTKAWLINGRRHRIDGPAYVNIKSDFNLFFVEGKEYTKEDYWNHPLVVEYKLKSILDI